MAGGERSINIDSPMPTARQLNGRGQCMLNASDEGKKRRQIIHTIV